MPGIDSMTARGSACDPALMSCAELAASGAAPPTPTPSNDEAPHAARTATSRGADFVRRNAGGAGGAPGGAPPAESKPTPAAIGACKTIVSNLVKSAGDVALGYSLASAATSRIPAPILYGAAAKFVTAVAADGVASLACDPED